MDSSSFACRAEALSKQLMDAIVEDSPTGRKAAMVAQGALLNEASELVGDQTPGAIRDKAVAFAWMRAASYLNVICGIPIE